jgi:hypothetical protein
VKPRDPAPGWLLGLLQGAIVAAAAVQLLRSPHRVTATPLGVDPGDVAAGYQRSDASLRWITFGLGALLATLLLVLVSVTIVQSFLTRSPVTVGLPTDLINGRAGGPQPAPPQLMAEPGADAARINGGSRARLQGYRWQDRQAGVVTIPIDRAMDLLVQRSAQASPTPAAPGYGVARPSDASSGQTEVGQWP